MSILIARDYTFETQDELAVDPDFDLAFDLAFEVTPHSPADTQRCRVGTATLPV